MRGTLSGHEDYPHINQKSTLSLVDLDMGLLGSQELLDRCRDVSRPFEVDLMAAVDVSHCCPCSSPLLRLLYGYAAAGSMEHQYRDTGRQVHWASHFAFLGQYAQMA
jgi:hypothetical protein